jgi:hypothetical protein
LKIAIAEATSKDNVAQIMSQLKVWALYGALELCAWNSIPVPWSLDLDAKLLALTKNFLLSAECSRWRTIPWCFKIV